jgi:hypothetical protein
MTFQNRRQAAMAIAAFLHASSIVATSAVAAGADSELASPYSERWLYCSANLQVDRSVDLLRVLFDRAGRNGYTGILFSDYKLQILDRVTQNYFGNVEKIKSAAAGAGLELVPAVFSIGYSNGHLSGDPNLAEGLPVVDQPYTVKNHVEAISKKGSARKGGAAQSRGGRLEAVLDSKPIVQLRNGGLEESRGDTFLNYSYQDDPGAGTFADRSVVHGGRVSCRLEAGTKDKGHTSPNLRLVQRVSVRPHTAYRFSCWIKTKDLAPTGSFHLLALATSQEGKSLTFREGGLEPTADWKKLDAVFNSLEEREVSLYAGFWGAGAGTFWIDDLALEELALVNLLRRKGCPFIVKSADGKTTYEEGRDYEPVADAKLGQVPFPGEYEFEHSGASIRITPRSRIRGGERLRVSWYHPIITQDSQVMCCLSDPKIYEILQAQARRVNELFRPKTFFMSHDEIRVANWCRACQDRKLTPGQILADNVRRCAEILKSVSPRARTVVWSDMFDPHHNAIDSYYLVNGSLKGSWEGLPRDVIIANWNSGKAKESLSFFADRGHEQIIAGYYDGDDLTNFQQWDQAARNVRGVFGFMYTTWQSKFNLLEQYGQAMRRSAKR